MVGLLVSQEVVLAWLVVVSSMFVCYCITCLCFLAILFFQRFCGSAKLFCAFCLFVVASVFCCLDVLIYLCDCLWHWEAEVLLFLLLAALDMFRCNGL